MLFAFLSFELHLLGEASSGAASFLGSNCPPTPPPPAWLEQRGQPHPASNLARSELKASRKERWRGVQGSGSGQPQGLTSLRVERKQAMCILGARGGGPGPLRPLDS